MMRDPGYRAVIRTKRKEQERREFIGGDTYSRVFNWSDQELGVPLTDVQSDDMLEAIGYNELKVENERYRKALENIAAEHLVEEMHDPESGDPYYALDEIITLARKALEETK